MRHSISLVSGTMPDISLYGLSAITAERDDKIKEDNTDINKELELGNYYSRNGEPFAFLPLYDRHDESDDRKYASQQRKENGTDYENAEVYLRIWEASVQRRT